MRLLTLVLCFLVSLSLFAEEFPLRSTYPDVKPISLSDLNSQLGSVTVVDVRSEFEYDVIHVKGAKNVLVSMKDFVDKLSKLVGGKKDAKIVTYCNGHTCAKSYKAAQAAQKAGFTNVYCFDAGIFEWTKAHPDKSVLLGKSPVDPGKIISKDKQKEQTLDKGKFEAGATKGDAFLIDARDPSQRKQTPDFAKKAANLPMDKLVKLLDNANFKAKIKGKTLYIFDAVGKQVHWLQYHLEGKGIKNYYFLDKGIWSYYGEKGAN